MALALRISARTGAGVHALADRAVKQAAGLQSQLSAWVPGQSDGRVLFSTRLITGNSTSRRTATETRHVDWQRVARATEATEHFCSSTDKSQTLGSMLNFKSIVDGKGILPEHFAGKAVLIVNTASLCGLTPQLKELEVVHRRFGNNGLVVLGVPSNDFGSQEPWEEERILDFYKKNFGVTFLITAKSGVIGPDAHPLYKAAIAEFGPDVGPQWNFHKMLLGPAGDLVGVFSSQMSPMEVDVTEAICEALKNQRGTA